MVGSGHSRICQGKGLHLLRSSLIIFVNLTETLFLFVSQRARVFLFVWFRFFFVLVLVLFCFLFLWGREVRVGEGIIENGYNQPPRLFLDKPLPFL